jgi:hypothetical protein
MLWFIGLALAGVLAVAWWGHGYPARLTIINSSGTRLENVSVTSGDQQITIKHIADGEFRRFSLSPGEPVVVRCGRIRWESAEALTPAQSLVVYALPGPRFEARSKLGSLTR